MAGGSFAPEYRRERSGDEGISDTWAVRFDEGGPVVRGEGGGDPLPVTLAACTPTECVVEEGLEEGDRVSRF